MADSITLRRLKELRAFVAKASASERKSLRIQNAAGDIVRLDGPDAKAILDELIAAQEAKEAA